MPKNKKSTRSDRDTAAKRPKTHPKDGIPQLRNALNPEQESEPSPFTVQQLFQLVPALVVQEIFNFLDVQEILRLGTAFPSWKSTLIRSPVRNKGIAFLEKPSFIHYHHIRYSPMLWFDIIPRQSILHLVLVKSTSDFHAYAPSFPSMNRRSDWPKKLTYAKNLFKEDCGWQRLQDLSVEPVHIFDCTIKFGPFFMPCSTEIEFWQSYWNGIRRSSRVTPTDGSYALSDIIWDFKVRVKSLVIPRIAGEVESRAYVQKALDEQKLMWPFPKEQLDWLMGSLSSLDETTIEAVKDADELWMKYRKHLNKLDLTTKATHDDRKLTSLDLAFLGRLLVNLNRAKPIPGFQQPPYPFPQDFKFHLVKRRRDF